MVRGVRLAWSIEPFGSVVVGVKRSLVILGCSVAFAAGPLVVAPPAAADCPWGTKPTRFEGVCIAGAGGGTAPIPPVPPSSSGPVYNPNGVGSVNGIPCTPEHYGTCLALMQQG
jgi:hypothetical protein